MKAEKMEQANDACGAGQPGVEAIIKKMQEAVNQIAAAQEACRSPQVLRIEAVQEKVQLKKSMIYAMVKNGTFPAPISLGGRVRGWLSGDVDHWISQRVAASRAQNPEKT